MKDACVRAVNAAMNRAIGRDLNAREVQNIEARVSRWMRQLGRANPSSWAAKSEPERLTEAGVAAAREIVADARRRKDNLERRVLRTEALQGFVDGQVSQGRDTLRIAAFDRILAPRADAGGAPEGGAVDQRAQGAYSDAVARMVEFFEAGKRRGIWRFIPFNEPGTNRALRRALAGETKDVPPEFAGLAKLAHETIDILRRRFNAAGGEIGRLEDWGEPHVWSDLRLIREIKRRGADAVIGEFVAAADRRKYVNEDGSPMTNDELTAFMTAALETIRTEGANKRVRGERPDYAVSVAANRHRAHREIHLRQDAVAAMLDKYSELGAMESLLRHLRALSRDVALIETFGPNAALSAQHLLERAFDADMAAFPERGVEIQTRRDAAERLLNNLTGADAGARTPLGDAMAVIRGYVAFKSLGSTVITSLTDPVIMAFTAKARGMRAAQLWINDVKAFVGIDRRWAKRAGLITDTVAGYADRLNTDYLAARDITARAASFTVKATGLNWVTEARRAAYGMTMMDAIGRLVSENESIAAVKADEDRIALADVLSVSEDIWAVWRLAELEDRGANHTLLSPQSIYAISDADLQTVIDGQAAAIEPDILRQRAASALLGIVKDETNTAVITAGVRERAALALGTRAGTLGGELIRSITMFKAFPWTFLTRQMELSRSLGGANVWRYRAGMFVSLTIMGAIVNWLYDLQNGRDPRAIDPTSREGRNGFWQALLRGGALGFYGDLLTPDPVTGQSNVMGAIGGPVAGIVNDAYNVTALNAAQAAAGEETNAGPEAVRFAQRTLTPNWWFTKSLTDRYIFQALQEEIEPGYNERMARRLYNARGTTYWWEPATPIEAARAPDLSRAIEGDTAADRRDRN